MAMLHSVSPDWTMYTGPDGGVGVWADTGVFEATTKMIARIQTTILLYIYKLYVIPDFEFIQPVRVDFQDISGRLARSVSWPPCTRKDSIHDNLFGIDPEDRQVHENEQHVDGSVETALTRLDEQQASIQRKAGTKHQAAQPAQKTVTIEGM
jgi:hypothetical protein